MDHDLVVGYWVRLPYVWKAYDDWTKCERLYILQDDDDDVFDETGQKIEWNKSNNDKHYYLMKFNNDSSHCNVVKHYFKVMPYGDMQKSVSYGDIRIAGVTMSKFMSSRKKINDVYDEYDNYDYDDDKILESITEKRTKVAKVINSFAHIDTNNWKTVIDSAANVQLMEETLFIVDEDDEPLTSANKREILNDARKSFRAQVNYYIKEQNKKLVNQINERINKLEHKHENLGQYISLVDKVDDFKHALSESCIKQNPELDDLNEQIAEFKKLPYVAKYEKMITKMAEIEDSKPTDDQRYQVFVKEYLPKLLKSLREWVFYDLREEEDETEGFVVDDGEVEYETESDLEPESESESELYDSNEQ
jgi:hypothetical protein